MFLLTLPPRRPVVCLAKARHQDDAWRVLHQLADDATPDLRRTLVAVLASVGAALPADRLAALVSAGDQAALEAVLLDTWETLGVQGLQDRVLPKLRTLALQAAEATALVGIDVAFNVQDDAALRAIDALAGQHLTQVSQTTREAVRGIVRRAFESGTPLTQQIAEISQVIGLTERQAVSLAAFRQGLIDAGESPARVQALVARRAQALRRQRAEVIARTESMAMVHEGQQERWRQAARDGLLEASRLRRTWLVTPDDRLCSLCAPVPGMNPEGVGLETAFVTPLGLVLHPPLHPSCRCVVTATLR